MRIVYRGYYGAKNSGDDAFVEVASWGAQKFWGCDKHLFLAPEVPNVTTKVNFINPVSNYWNFSKSIFEVFRSDFFISAGGSTFHSSLGKSDLRTYAKLKKKLKVPGQTGAVGVSLGPYKTLEAEKNTISYLKTLDFLALRDKHSYDLACSYNLSCKVVNAFDLAALLPDIYSEKMGESDFQSATKIVGVSVCNFERYVKGDVSNEIRRNTYFKELLKSLASPDILFRFFIFNGNPVNGDQRLTEEFIADLAEVKGFKYEVVPYLSDVKKTWDMVSTCSLMISTRLHASIFACFANIPFFLFEYHRKCNDFLNDVGHSEQYKLFDGHRNMDEITNQILDLLNGSSYREPINLAESKIKALRNFTLNDIP